METCLYVCYMKKLTSHELLKKRREDAFVRLRTIAKQKTTKGNITLSYVTVGGALRLTSQTVYNYVQGKGKDGFIVEALIKEFKKL